MCGERQERRKEMVLTCTHNLCFKHNKKNIKKKKNSENFQFLKLRKILYFTRAGFRNEYDMLFLVIQILINKTCIDVVVIQLWSFI